MNSVLAELCDGVEKFLGFFPSKAWIGNRFTINMITANLLITWFNIAFNHQSLDQLVKLWINNAAVQDFFGNTNLLFILFVGIGVVGINDDSRILQIFSQI